MTAADAEIVLRARKLLKDWDGPPVSSELASAIREVLAPMLVEDHVISSDARKKLEEISAVLDRMIDEALTPEALDALDILMLGLWIRIELLAETPLQ